MAEHPRPRLRPLPALVVLAALLTLFGLGTWQMERRAWKADLLARIEQGLSAPPVPLPADPGDPESWSYRRVTASGRFLHDREMPLSSRLHDGKLGYHILTPLERPDGSILIVNRGWVPLDRLDPASRVAGLPEGPVTVEGIVRVPAERGWMQPENRPAENVWYWVDLRAMAERLGRPVQGILLEAGPAANPGGLPVGGVTQVNVPNNHLQYALTWYGLAVVLVFIVLAYRRQSVGMSRQQEGKS